MKSSTNTVRPTHKHKQMPRYTDMHKGHADTKTCANTGTHIQTHRCKQTKYTKAHRYIDIQDTQRDRHTQIYTEHTYMSI